MRTDPEQALGCFEQAQALYPEESAPYISYAYALYCAQDYERCISYIEDELGLGKAYDIEAQSQLAKFWARRILNAMTMPPRPRSSG